MKIKELNLGGTILNIYDDCFLSKEEIETTKEKIADIIIDNYHNKLYNSIW